ncbi:MAG TPA: septum formation initiator family protein [Gemmatimonadaceae bacterium]|nr:septum formation initiator family protein [Gemmatimonadaceae bacterium]
MPPRRVSPRLVIWLALLACAVVFAVQGGEYGTLDLFRQRARRVELQAKVDSVRHEVDSLRRYHRSIATDPRVQERIAREDFGMIRPGEVLYRYVEPSRGAAAGSRTSGSRTSGSRGSGSAAERP